MSGDRFRVNRSLTTGQPFRVEDLPQVDAEKLDAPEMAAIERAVIERENVISKLQTDVLEFRSERDVLQNRVSKLETERNELQERIRQLEVERPNLEPQAVFTNLGSAVGSVREELAGANYTIGDVEFNLKANVVGTDEGLRIHLPSVDETFAAENLSEITFRVRSEGGEERAEADYNEVPDLLGLARSAAEKRLGAAGLSVGEVTTVDDPDEEPGTVVEQFPEPYTIAPPDSPVDLTVVAEREPASDQPASDTTTAESSTGGSTPTGPSMGGSSPTRPAGAPARPDSEERLREEFEAAIERRELDAESELARRLADARVDDLRSLVELEPAEIAAATGLSEESAERLHGRLVERVGEAAEKRRLETISGIGPTYASRLRESGVEGVAALAELDPEEVADITGASTSRTEEWVNQARSRRR